ncbi:hypothetical protein LEP1GSC021_0101 [Leptospira noguchii str. 1993005606]|nr:hypothetical protein LEP1GSC021_0101 [Leptospira noguchii str. 1993005606]
MQLNLSNKVDLCFDTRCKIRQVLVKEASKENIQLRQSYKNLPTSFFGKKTRRTEPCSLIFL